MKKTATCIVMILCAATSSIAASIDFEDLAVPPSGYYSVDVSGQDLYAPVDHSWNYQGAGFSHFGTNWGGGYTSWDGLAYSNETDTTSPGFGNQYVSAPGGGSASANYAVLYDPGAFGNKPVVTLPSGMQPVSISLTNTAWAVDSMTNGDSLTTPFGDDTDAAGDPNDPNDWTLLTITGSNAGGTTGTVECYLADYRFEDDYILQDWTTFDLTSLGPATTLSFSVTASDSGVPTYAAIDNIEIAEATPEPSGLLLVVMGMLALPLLRSRKD